ncbi:MAG: NfeD family protein [Clostridium sp.]
MVVALINGFTLLSGILLILGFLLVGIELFMPGFSVPGIAGSICLIASVFMATDTFAEALIMTIGILAILGIMLGIALSLFAKGKGLKPLILTESQKKEKGYISSSDLNYLLGKEGETLTDLRPTGIGDFEGVNFEISSEGQYIAKGTKIVIYKVNGSRIIVKVKK